MGEREILPRVSVTSAITTSSFRAEPSPFLEPVLLILLASLPPIPVIDIPFPLPGVLLPSFSWLYPPCSDILCLLVYICLLTHDQQVLPIPLRLWICLQELLRRLWAVELHENRAFECFVVGTAEADSVRRAVRVEEGFNVKLRGGDLRAEAFGVDRAGHGAVFEDADHVGAVITVGFRERGLALDLDILVFLFNDVEEGRIFESGDDRGKGFEAAHALEGIDKLEVDRIILGAADLSEEKFVLREVRVGEIEFNLVLESALLSL